ncbi:hypothetical protein GCM10007385_01680 [Tateyamaria omphalii]|nr:hypothetical protein GCM10007385_01680 [Tateyamaria omphalii]
MSSDAALDRQYSHAARHEWRKTERFAVELVETLINSLSIDVDRHSHGETCLAHKPRAFEQLKEEAASIYENYGVEPDVLPPSELASAGLSGPFHGALTIPIGFGLNPRKYLDGLIKACLRLGVAIYDNSPALNVTSGTVKTPEGVVRAEQIVVATNGYSSEDTLPWMAARYMPAQSTVIVTRPLTAAELQDQGWSSDQMCYDTRHLLHYFRLMPDRRFLFGMRGGLLSGPKAEKAARSKVVRDFRSMFPTWSHVDVTHAWSGLVCLSRDRVPYVGPVPGMPGVLTGFAYHGNGVAMGTYTGYALAALASGQEPDRYPSVMSNAASRFPLGRFRRLLMPPVYAGFGLNDALP